MHPKTSSIAFSVFPGARRLLGQALVPVFCMIVYMLYCSNARAYESGWKLSQSHRNLGPATTYVSPRGVRLVFSANDFVFASHAPDWELLLYNEKSKKMLRKPYSQWSVEGISTALSLNDNSGLKSVPKTKGKLTTYADHKARIYLLAATDRKGNPRFLAKSDFGQYLGSSVIKTDPRAIEFAQKVFDIPEIGLFPLKVTKFCRSNSYGFGMKYNKEKSMIKLLSTSKVEAIKNPRVKPLLPLSAYKKTPQSEIIVNRKEFSDFFKYMYDKDEKKKPEPKSR